MPLSFICPACGMQLLAPDAAAGKTGSCKYCKVSLVAPESSGGKAVLASAQASTESQDAPASDPTVPPNAGPEPAGSGYPGASYPGYGSAEGTPPGGPAMPPGDLMANPSIGKAFMSISRPASADFWKRVLAFAIDLVIITAILIGLRYVLTGGHMDRETSIFVVPKREMNWALWVTLALFGTKVMYGALLEGSPLQATLGKALLGMKVCTEYGDRITPLNAVWRNVCKWAIVSVVGFVPILGMFRYFIFFYAMNDEYTRTLHDMTAGTVVAERYW